MKKNHNKCSEAGRIRNTLIRSEKGFTLVELIVVLVILAILAAIVTPALLGYIDKAKQEKEMTRAAALRDLAQAELTQLYAKSDVPAINHPIFETKKPTDRSDWSNNGDVDATDSDFADQFFKMADIDDDHRPYLFMIAVGSNKVEASKSHASKHDKYTIFYSCYMETENSTPIYYYNGEWTTDNPSNVGVFRSGNFINQGPRKDLKLQYYLLSNKTGRGLYDSYGDKTKNLWSYLKDGFN